jgi:chaperonin GroEL
VALLRAAKSLKTKGDNEDQDAGISIVRRALQAPVRQIAENAGVEGSIVVGKITDQKAASYGYDAQNNEYGDLIAKGIIDPAKVVRTALQDAASVAGLLVTTEAGVAEAPKKAAEGHTHMPGGGMGGMDMM